MRFLGCWTNFKIWKQEGRPLYIDRRTKALADKFRPGPREKAHTCFILVVIIEKQYETKVI